MKFIDIATGSLFAGTLPIKVQLPVHKKEPIPHSTIVESKQGDPDWEEALERHMFFQGYILESEL